MNVNAALSVSATPCPPRLYPLVWHARAFCAEELARSHGQWVARRPSRSGPRHTHFFADSERKALDKADQDETEGVSCPSHVVAFPLRMRRWLATRYGDSIILGSERQVAEVVQAEESLIERRSELWRRLREEVPIGTSTAAWDAAIADAMRHHSEPEAVEAHVRGGGCGCKEAA